MNPHFLAGLLGAPVWGLGVAIVGGIGLLTWKMGRPLAKGAIVGALSLTERAREVTAEATEQIQDIYAEARSEFETRANN